METGSLHTASLWQFRMLLGTLGFMKDRPKQKASSARALVALNTKVLREEAGVSQESLAEAAGFHRTYVGRIEKGDANLTLDALEKLAVALEVPVGRLLTRS